MFLGAYLLYSTSRYVSVGRRQHGDGSRRVDRRSCRRASASTSRARCRPRSTAAAVIWILNNLYLAGADGRRARHADLPLQPQPRRLRAAAQHRPGDVADRDADLRALPRRPAAAGRHRHARHDHERRRRPARLRADHLLLQPARRGPEPARGLRARRRRRALRRVPQPAGPRRWRWAWAPTIGLAVVATGNHFVFDIAAGVVVTIAGYVVGNAVDRKFAGRRPWRRPVLQVSGGAARPSRA